MFQVGDLVMYGNIGACRITDIAPHVFPGADNDMLYYYLEPLYENCKVFTPVDSNQVFMRPVISKEEANRLIDLIPSIKSKPYVNRDNKEVEEAYKKCIKTFDCTELLKLTISICTKKEKLESQNLKIGVVDDRYMRRAEDMLFGEFAAALEISKDDVADYINKRVGDEEPEDGE